MIRISPAGLPVVEYEVENGKYNFSINNKWSRKHFDSFYWEINGEKIFEPTTSYSTENLNFVRLVVWNKKEDDSVKGIHVRLK